MFTFLVARSDSRRTDFNERDLELRNCRRRRPVSRESSVVSRPFSSLRDRRGFPSSSTRFARSLTRFFALLESSVSNAWCVKWGMHWEGELINWLIDWFIARLHTDMELEKSTCDVPKESEASVYDEWLYSFDGTESRLVRFLFYCSSYRHKMKWTSPIPFLGISDSVRIS